MGIRDRLAFQRSLLANERTLLAYMRTSIVFFASAITLFKFFYEDKLLMAFSLVLGALSVVMAFWGFYFYKRTKTEIDTETKTETKKVSGSNRKSPDLI